MIVQTVIAINGRELRDMIREVERPFAEAEGRTRLVGAYIGLPSARPDAQA